MTITPQKTTWSSYYKELYNYFNDRNDTNKEIFRRQLQNIQFNDFDGYLDSLPFMEKFVLSLLEDLDAKVTIIINLWNPLSLNQDPLHLYVPNIPGRQKRKTLEQFTAEKMTNKPRYLFWNDLVLNNKKAKKDIYLIKLNKFIPGFDEKNFPGKIVTSKDELKQLIVAFENPDPVTLEKYLDRLNNVYFSQQGLYRQHYESARAVLFIPSQSNYDIATGALLIVFEQDAVKIDLSKIWEWWSAFSLLQHNISSCADKDLQRRYAIKSSVAAMISRNHSHHIGSHVMPRTTVSLIEQKLIERLKLQMDIANPHILSVIGKLKGRLDDYIQKKADFTAEIATEPLISTKVTSFLRGIIYPFVSNTLVIDTICDNEGISYINNQHSQLKVLPYYNGKKLDLTFKCSSELCEEHPSLSNYPYSATCGNKELYEHSELTIEDGDEDIEVAVPGPLGEYALYSFLENLIRNAAKHNHNNNKELSIYISITDIDKDNDFYNIEIWDSVSDPNQEIQITDKTINKTVNIKLVEYLAGALSVPIINENLSMKKGAWGLGEMKIMATLLGGSDDYAKIEDPLQIIGCNKKEIDREVKDRLVYRFKLMRPRKVAILCEKEKHKPNMEKEGIWYFSSVEKYIGHFRNAKSKASFEFVIINPSLLPEIKKYYIDDKEYHKLFLSSLPFRVFVHKDLEDNIIPGAMKVTPEFINKLLESTDIGIYDSLWEEWVKQFNVDKNYSLVVYLEQTEGVAPTKDWIEYAESKKWSWLKVCPKYKIKQVIKTIENDSKIIVYDRHFNTYKNGFQGVALKAPIVFHEIIEKNSSDFINIFEKPKNETVFGMLEAAFLNVLIIDERVAERAYDDIMKESSDIESANELYGDNNRISAALKAGIYICTHFDSGIGEAQAIHNSGEDKYPRIEVLFDEDSVKSCNYQFSKNDTKKTFMNNSKRFPDVLIIHQGFIENFLNVRNIDLFISNVRKEIPFIVVDSGRGIPPGLPKTVKFLPFSLLEDWVMKERISKYNLTRYLMAASRRETL